MILETRAELAAGGQAVARAPDGRVVFVEGAAPRERVEVEVLQDNKTFLRARVESVLVPGPDRVAPACDVFGVCGGCVTQHVSAAAQVEGKAAAFRETLRRVGHVDPAQVQLDPPWSGPPYGYRGRARLAVAPGPTVGFRGRGSHRVVDVERCPVLTPAAQAALTWVRMHVSAVPKPDEIELVSAGEEALVALPRRLANANPRALELPPSAEGTRVRAVRAEAETPEVVVARDGHGALPLSPEVFAQANAVGNEALLGYVLELAGEPAGTVLELYSGSGNLTRALAPRAGRVVAVESGPHAVALARTIAPANVELVEDLAESTLERWVSAGRKRPDVVVLDPPREGLSPEVAERLALLEPTRVVYVSCDPATFARDVARLTPRGLRLVRARLFDLYPQSAHAEVVGLLVAEAHPR